MNDRDERTETAPFAVQRASLWSAFARGIRDNLAAELVVQTLRVGGVLILARELSPANFGVLKILLIVSTLVAIFSEAGFPDALIQRLELSPSHQATALWLTSIFAAFTIGVLFLTAPLIETAMEMRGLGFALRLICLPLFLEATVIVGVARLTRSLRFGALACADIVGETAFLITAFALLWRGDRQWSLPGALAVRFAAHAASIWIADAQIPRVRPSMSAARDLGRFAMAAMGGRLVTVASGNTDFLLIGRLLGSTTLGYYSIAWDLLRFVPDRLHRVVGRVAIPAFCKLQSEDAELRRAYCDLIGYMARLILPISAFVALTAPELLSSLYGSQWLPAAAPMRMLAFGLALLGLRIGIGAIYYAKNHPEADIYINGLRLLLIIAAVASTARFGLVAVSAAMSLVEAVISIIGQYVVAVLIGLTFHNFVAALRSSFRVTAACVIAAVIGRLPVLAYSLHGPLALLSIALPTALMFLWMESGELTGMVRGAFGGMAGGLSKLPSERSWSSP